MNARDAAKVLDIISNRYADLKEREAMQDLSKKDRAAVLREMREIAALYPSLKKAATPAPRREPKQIVVGRCPCGEDVRISERYATTVNGEQTVSRSCDCGRTNDVVLTTHAEHRPVNWTAVTCFCGRPVRVRSEYAGAGFTEYRGPLDFAGRSRKNRTVKATCRCDCRWTFTIRFAEDGDGKVRRTISPVVSRCRKHAAEDIPGLTPVEPRARRRGAKSTPADA